MLRQILQSTAQILDMIVLLALFILMWALVAFHVRFYGGSFVARFA